MIKSQISTTKACCCSLQLRALICAIEALQIRSGFLVALKIVVVLEANLIFHFVVVWMSILGRFFDV